MDLVRERVKALGPSTSTGTWARTVAQLGEAAVPDLLALADELRAGDVADRLRAHGVYAALRDRLDPADPEDGARVAFALVARSIFDWMEPAAEMAERAARSGVGDARSRGRLVQLQLLASRGELEVAGEGFLDLLRELRGRPDEFLVTRSLVTYFSLSRREFEALVFAGRTVELAVASGDPRAEASARAQHCYAIFGVGDTDRLETELDRLDALLDRLGPQADLVPLRYAASLRADLGLVRGDAALVRAALARLDASTPPEHASDQDRVSRLETLVELDLIEGEPVRAAARLREIEHLGSPYRHSLVVRKEFELRVLGDAAPWERRRALAREILAVLEDPASGLGTGHLIERSASLGRALDGTPELSEEARRAHEVATLAVLRRIAEIERCVREIPELTRVAPEDLRTLTLARERFVRTQGEMLARVHDLLLEDARTGRRPLRALESRHGVIPICAWCRQVGTQDGRWLPVGHFLPNSPTLRLTHGICPTCLREARAPERGRQADAARRIASATRSSSARGGIAP